MLKTTFYCALAVCVAAGSIEAQSSSKEYIRIGGRVIAIENSAVTVTSPASYTITGCSINAGLTASGGSGTYTWSVTSGSLPTGVSLVGSTLSGTVQTCPATAYFTVTATDSSGLLSGSLPMTLIFNSANLTVNTSSLPGVVVSAAYPLTTLTATGGTGSGYAWSVTSGALPAGLALSSGGTISGTPTVVGDPSFTVTVTDSGGNSAKKALSIDVVNALSSITPSSLPLTECSGSYSQTVSASGGQTPYTWSVNSGSLPTGLTLSSGGTISGTACPQGGSASTFTVKVTDSLTPTGLTASQQYTIIPNPAITGPSSFPSGTPGSAYSAQLTASGGTAPYSWAITNPASGSWLSFSQSSPGLASGTPGNSGTYNFTATVTDAHGWTASKPFSITVSAGIVITTPSGLLQATAGTSYSESFYAQGGTPPYTWTLVAGGLPFGLSLSSSGVLSGNPYEGTWGTYSYTPNIRVTDATGLYAQGNFSLVVYAPPTGGPGVTGMEGTWPGGPEVYLYTSNDNNQGQQPTANWSVSGSGIGNYGPGTVSPTSGTTYTYYTAPTAIVYDQFAYVTAANGSGSSAGGFPLSFPTPIVTLAGTAMTGQTVQLDTGQTFTLSITANQGDNWSSGNDYVNVYFATNSCQIFYYPASRTVYLANDGSAGLSGGFSSGTIGTAGSLSTGSCTVGLNGSATYNSQGYLMTVNLPISFSAAENGLTATVNVFQPDTGWTMGSVSIVTPGVTLTPATVTLGPPGQTQQFTATVTGESNTGVNWTLSNTALGSVSISGLYTAPLSILTQQAVTVTATSQANGALTATSVVTLSPTACGTTDLNLPNTTLTSGTTTEVGVHNVIANSGFSISGSAAVSFQACNQIILGPGFTAVAGSAATTFTAVIN